MSRGRFLQRLLQILNVINDSRRVNYYPFKQVYLRPCRSIYYFIMFNRRQFKRVFVFIPFNYPVHLFSLIYQGYTVVPVFSLCFLYRSPKVTAYLFYRFYQVTVFCQGEGPQAVQRVLALFVLLSRVFTLVVLDPIDSFNPSSQKVKDVRY